MIEKEMTKGVNYHDPPVKRQTSNKTDGTRWLSTLKHICMCTRIFMNCPCSAWQDFLLRLTPRANLGTRLIIFYALWCEGVSERFWQKSLDYLRLVAKNIFFHYVTASVESWSDLFPYYMLNSWVDKFIDALWFDIGVFDKKKQSRWCLTNTRKIQWCVFTVVIINNTRDFVAV